MKFRPLTFLIFLSVFIVSFSFSAKQIEKKSTYYKQTLLLSEENDSVNKILVELGEMLFFDKNLSANGKISCASCHNPRFAFSDTAIFSAGLNGKPTKFQSMALVNVTTDSHFFWDGRVNVIEKQIFHPILDSFEMGNIFTASLINRLNKNNLLRNRFSVITNKPKIDSFDIINSIVSFLKNLNSDKSNIDILVKKYGEYNGIDPFDSIAKIYTSKVKLVLRTCEFCHNGSNYGGVLMANNGLSKLQGYFKAPTLRNIAQTAPYMHDGRFKTLEEVVDFYNCDITNAPNLHAILKDSVTDKPLQFDLDEVEKKQLIHFLNQMTDSVFLKKGEALAKKYGY